jgi:hypothetical protein
MRIQACIHPRLARRRDAPRDALLVRTKCKHHPIGVTRCYVDDPLPACSDLDRNLCRPFGDPSDPTGRRSIG